MNEHDGSAKASKAMIEMLEVGRFLTKLGAMGTAIAVVVGGLKAVSQIEGLINGPEHPEDQVALSPLDKKFAAEREAIAKKNAGMSKEFGRADTLRNLMPEAEKLKDLDKERLEINKSDVELIRARRNGFIDDVSLAQSRLVLANQLTKNENERLVISNSQKLVAEGEFKVKQATLDATYSQFEAEQKRVRSVQGQTGRQTDLEKAEAEELAKRIADGTASDDDYKRAEQLIPKDLLGDRSDKHFAERGKDHTNRLNSILGNKPLEGRDSEIDDLKKQGEREYRDEGEAQDTVQAFEEMIKRFMEAVKRATVAGNKRVNDFAAAANERAVNGG